MLTALQMLPRLRGVNQNGVTQIIDALADPVDPAKTERFIYRFWPRDARLLGALLAITNPQFLRDRVILLQPSTKIVC